MEIVEVTKSTWTLGTKRSHNGNWKHGLLFTSNIQDSNRKPGQSGENLEAKDHHRPRSIRARTSDAKECFYAFCQGLIKCTRNTND